MWNSSRYTSGYTAAETLRSEQPMAEVIKAYYELDGAAAVDEFEVGFRTFIEAHGGTVS